MFHVEQVEDLLHTFMFHVKQDNCVLLNSLKCLVSRETTIYKVFEMYLLGKISVKIIKKPNFYIKMPKI